MAQDLLNIRFILPKTITDIEGKTDEFISNECVWLMVNYTFRRYQINNAKTIIFQN